MLVATAGALAGLLGRAGEARAQEISLQSGRVIVPEGETEVTVRGLTLTESSIGFATAQAAGAGTSCWIALNPRLGTATITQGDKAKVDTPVAFLIVG